MGAKRILNNAFHETLVEIDRDKRILKYSIDDGSSPASKEEVSNYYGVAKLSPTTDRNETHVEWSASRESNVEDAVEFCHGIYVALLMNWLNLLSSGLERLTMRLLGRSCRRAP